MPLGPAENWRIGSWAHPRDAISCFSTLWKSIHSVLDFCLARPGIAETVPGWWDPMGLEQWPRKWSCGSLAGVWMSRFTEIDRTSAVAWRSVPESVWPISSTSTKVHKVLPRKPKETLTLLWLDSYSKYADGDKWSAAPLRNVYRWQPGTSRIHDLMSWTAQSHLLHSVLYLLDASSHHPHCPSVPSSCPFTLMPHPVSSAFELFPSWMWFCLFSCLCIQDSSWDSTQSTSTSFAKCYQFPFSKLSLSELYISLLYFPFYFLSRKKW